MSDELAKLIAKQFIERRDVKAWQQPNGAYLPDRRPVKKDDLLTHLAGEQRREFVPGYEKDGKPYPITVGSMGHYLVSAENRCRLFAYDLDLKKVWTPEPGVTVNAREEFLNPQSRYRDALVGDLVMMAEGLARRAHRTLDLPVAISFSGSKGVHVYVFTGSEPAADVRGAALEILEGYGCFVPVRGNNFFQHDSEFTSLEIEVFPKQESLDGKDLGNLMRLPLGKNFKTNKPSTFLRCVAGERARFHRMDAIDALSGKAPWE